MVVSVLLILQVSDINPLPHVRGTFWVYSGIPLDVKCDKIMIFLSILEI